MAFDTIIQTSNAAWFGFLGYDERDVASKNFLDLVHPDDRARAEVELVRHTRAMFAARLRSKDGSYRQLRWWSIAITETSRIYAIGRAEHSSLASSERLL
jgi:PAS domain S-box-containing protein